MAGIAHQHRYAQQIFIVERTFSDQPVLADQVSMIGGEDDQCVVSDARLVDIVQDAANLLVDQADHAVVGGGAAT